jgi:hypothetical protein
LQSEVKQLQTRMTAADGAAAAAVAKFERDLFAQQAALARDAAAAAKKQAAEVKEDVMALPAGGVHKTINWSQDKKTE